MSAREPVALTYTITVPQASIWDAERAHQFMAQTIFAFGTLVFRIVATADTIVWQLVDGVGYEQRAIKNTIRANYPDAEISAALFGTEESPSVPYPLYRTLIAYQHTVPLFVAPLQYVTDLKGPDPLAAVTHAMSNLQAGERVIYTVIVAGPANY